MSSNQEFYEEERQIWDIF